MAPLRIGINALYLIPGGVGGTEIYLRRLLAALAELDPVNRYFIFSNREAGSGLTPERPNFSSVPMSVRAAFRPARIVWEQTALPLAVARRHIDVLLNPGFTAPVYCPCAAVTVFHDLQYMRHPEFFSWLDLQAWRALLPLAAWAADIVLADSQATAADLRACYRLPERKLRVVPLGVDAEFFEIAQRRRPQPYLLTVSTLHPHKNLDGLLRAFAEFRLRNGGYRLIVAGMRGFSADRLERLRGELGLTDAVEFTGWIARERLYELYAGAYAFVYPSRFEGFGIPVLEAMASGIPTACSDIPPLQELSHGAALHFHPDDIAGMRDALLQLVEDQALRSELAAAGPRRAARYSWAATARGTLDALLAAAQGLSG